MIDVLLVLLVIFLLIVPQVPRAIEAQLPQPAAGPGGAGAALTVVAIGAGRYALDGAEPGSADAGMTRGALLSRIRAWHATSPAAALFVRGAEGARYDDVFAALDLAKGAGVRTVALSPRLASPSGGGARK